MLYLHDLFPLSFNFVLSTFDSGVRSLAYSNEAYFQSQSRRALKDVLDAVVVSLNGGRSASVHGVLSVHAAVTSQL